MKKKILFHDGRQSLDLLVVGEQKEDNSFALQRGRSFFRKSYVTVIIV